LPTIRSVNQNQIIAKLMDDGALNEGCLLKQQIMLAEDVKGPCRCDVKGVVAAYYDS
jgi:hypothetical protein